ncbi:phosphatidate cytidylyltransferase [Palleronia sp. KMU-117]|uniref:phosphatidate cytidylyltransferase n=1 Tax=Palleronia sp. KMU-117 TaxID=3434108 RepID=UPI003D72AF58
MTASSGQWDDLIARIGSGGVLAFVGIAAMWAGGLWFHVLVALCSGVMVWELGRMLGGGVGVRFLGIAAALAILVAGELAPALALPVLLAPAIVAYGQVPAHRPIFAAYTALILLAGFELMAVRDGSGFVWMAWLALVVIATDVLGYFAGRMIGGPKFWPRVSPKKTWSGTAAGWIGAAVVGTGFLAATGSGAALIALSVLVSMASQAGDLAESAIKRMAGVKDSSSILPGHGGLFDRFDGMLGASILLLVLSTLFGFPPEAVQGAQ